MPEVNDDKDGRVKSGKFLAHSELLSYEELLRVVRLTVAMGMNKLRLTGGEPLVRKGVLDFIHQLSKLDGLDQVRLTTNGVLLADYAEDLAAAGVDHINVSLDTLQAEKFTRITGKNFFDRVWRGLESARDLGLKIKINVVAMKGVNDDEFVEFANIALDNPFQVRFIEFMPVGDTNSWNRNRFIKAEEVQEMLAGIGTLTPFRKFHGEGPARMYEIESPDGRTGAVGFISPISHHFCDQCNRLRLTSEGRLRACLLNDTETDLKSLIRGGATDQELAENIRQTILQKPQGHTLDKQLDAENKSGCGTGMSRIGG